MIGQESHTAAYRCPGEAHAISRAVHLGRLARFYPGCRQCPQREDTGTLSPRQVRWLQETQSRGGCSPRFHENGMAGVYGNELGPRHARDLAAAMGIWLQRRSTGATTDPRLLVAHSGCTIEAGPSRFESPCAVIAGDGRPICAELIAAVSDGLRYSGCHVVDIGPATAACLGFTIERLGASGGVLVGNPGRQPQYAGLKFFDSSSQPLSAGGSLDSLREIYESGVDRATRRYGSLRRYQADASYLASLAAHYHALRPLRLLLASASAPLGGYLHKLTAQSACRIIPFRASRDGLAEQVRQEAAHVAAEVDGNGESCQVFDEQGRAVPAERLVSLLSRNAFPDALLTLTLLLNLLSQSDRPLSEVVGQVCNLSNG